ncbi:MAG: B12-binding domain-containing radical SAM protein [Candidatus Hydrogenedentota bacterium]|nr:MAG: B12-binding domain-containing radical SAM protein [Candidatus Hydrogenedentota bacterium]
MKVVLLNPPEMIAGEEGGTGFGARSFVKQLRVLPPLGLAYIAAVLKAASHEVKLIDANALRIGPEEIVRRVDTFSPDVVGITCVTPLFPVAVQICRSLKNLSPRPQIVVGGPQVTIMPELTMEKSAFDFGVAGEAEIAMPRLIDTLSGGGTPDGIGGLIFRDGDEVVRAGSAEVMPINEIPFPLREILPNDRYFDLTTEARRVSSIMTARGCPYQCSFCERYIRGGHYRARNADNVVSELEELVTRYGCTEVVIYDDTFTASKKRAAEICEKILERGLKFRWDCRTRVDCVDPGLLRLMARAGCSRISYGVESAAADVLDLFDKKITLEQVEETFEWTRSAGIKILAYFMLGAPEETRESIEKTLALSMKLDPDFAYYSVVVPYPGTDLYDNALRKELLHLDYWKDFVKNEGDLKEPIPMFEHNDVTREYLVSTLRSAYLRFYLRPRYILKRCRSIKSLSDFIWHLKMAKVTVMT